MIKKQYAREISEAIDIQMDSSRRVRVSAKSPPMEDSGTETELETDLTSIVKPDKGIPVETSDPVCV